ncbi:hypothetical protein XENTR_v10007595 [Xenopus tropicalis]|uniref:Lactosylceramide 4-alpha-galactosyltransferase n=3 Tax=Xenopus tropicalis TaxID=8364 RepID=A0A8J0QXX2_XENTR|nr:lactosylceramide 4-alpha-galactosyltransferase [Xenopus tropicalis]KAE8613148.1 hypothetical protein XENTR_v10007595 [Xenopus tropicalis]
MRSCPPSLPLMGFKVKSPWSLLLALLVAVPFLVVLSMKPTGLLGVGPEPYHWPADVKCPGDVPDGKNHSPTGRIYFVETSERMSPNAQFMCAVESAVRTHPDTQVTILMRGLYQQHLPRPPNLAFRLFRCFPNVDVAPLDFERLFADTPLSSWYSAVEGHKEATDLPILSDASRLAILWKYGGVYLDTDFVVLKRLTNLANSMGTQSTYTLNGAFLSFARGHKFIELCMKDFTDSYNFWLYGHQGPQLLTRVFKRWCSIRRLRDRRSCRGVSVLPQEAFYPIEWQNWRKYFELISPSDLKGFLRNTYAVHVWNKKSKDSRPEPGTFLDQLQSQCCPTAYGLMKMSL